MHASNEQLMGIPNYYALLTQLIIDVVESLLGELLAIVKNVEQPSEVILLAFKMLYFLTKVPFLLNSSTV